MNNASGPMSLPLISTSELSGASQPPTSMTLSMAIENPAYLSVSGIFPEDIDNK